MIREVYNQIALLLLCYYCTATCWEIVPLNCWSMVHAPPRPGIVYTAVKMREERRTEWCILITPTTQIELIETIANKSTCVRASFAKRLLESKHEHCSHIKNITFCFTDGGSVGGVDAFWKSGRTVTRFICTNIRTLQHSILKRKCLSVSYSFGLPYFQFTCPCLCGCVCAL